MARTPPSGSHQGGYDNHRMQQEMASKLVPLLELAKFISMGDVEPEGQVDGQPGQLYIRKKGGLFRKVGGHGKSGWEELQAVDTSHGNLAGGSLHSVATTSEAGFMSSADKTKLDSSEVTQNTATGIVIPGSGSVTLFTFSLDDAVPELTGGWILVRVVIRPQSSSSAKAAFELLLSAGRSTGSVVATELRSDNVSNMSSVTLSYTATSGTLTVTAAKSTSGDVTASLAYRIEHQLTPTG